MRRLLIVALVASCERSESPPPAPRDAGPPIDAMPACRRQPDPVRLRALDAFRDYAATVKREHSPVEAQLALTDAYIALELGYAYARLGADTRALVQKTKAHRVLDEPARTDHVHHTLLAIYDARIEQAQRCQPVDTPLPIGVETELSNLDRVERYKVDRLRESSATLSREYVVDAIGEFSRKANLPDDPFNVARRTADPAERARVLGKALDALPADGFARDRMLVLALDMIGTLPPALAKPLLARIAAAVKPPGPFVKDPPTDEHTGRVQDWAVYGHLIAIAMRGDPVLARTTVELVAKQINGDPATLEAILRPSVLALRDEPALLRTLLATAPTTPRARASALVAPQSFAIAKALVITGDTATAKLVIEDLQSYLAGAENRHSRWEAIRELAGIYGLSPATSALADVEKLEPALANATDSFGTNSHFCLSPIKLVAAISHGIVGE